MSAAIRRAMRSNEPTEGQWRAISHPEIPVVVIAGAGSGKTAVMAARMVWMVEECVVDPSEILGLTFTNKAAGELEERVAAAFAEMDPPPDELPTISTYNSFADRVVRENGVRIGIDPDSALLSRAQSWQLMLEALGEIEPFEAVDSRSTATICRNALALADQCDNNFVTPEELIEEDSRLLSIGEHFDQDVLTNSRRRIELARLVRAYMELKKRRRCIDYGDQVTKAVEILETFEDVRSDLRARYPAILLDEYQDTNVAQRRMMQALAPEGSNITAVGDARQNIFQWRGSTLFNLIDFPSQHFLREGGSSHGYLSLPDNFRSGSRILAVANSVIAHVPEERRPGLDVRPFPANGEGFVGTKLLRDQRAEARFIAEEIRRLHGAPVAPGRVPAAWRDYAVLVRRKAMMGEIYSVMSELDIPVEVLGLGGLLQVPEVVDAVAWLRLIADPGPSANRWLARILMGPRFRVHYRDLAVLARWAARRTKQLGEDKKGHVGAHEQQVVWDETQFEPDEVAFSILEALDHLEEIPELGQDVMERLEVFRTDLAALRALAGGTLLDLVQAVVRVAGILEALQSSPRRDASSSTSNLTQFIGMVANFSPVSGEATLHEFLDYLDAAEDADDTLEFEGSATEDSVKLTTVHRAKGLEFEVVFVPTVAARLNDSGVKVESIFPDERSANPMTSVGLLPHGVRGDRDHLPSPFRLDADGTVTLKKKPDYSKELKSRAVEDERRLFYVALTRAKQRLYVTSAWWYERHLKPRGPSVFFDEVAASPHATDLGRESFPEQSPLIAELASRAVWPPRVMVHGSLPGLSEGYREAVASLRRGETTSEELLQRLGAEERRKAEALLEEHRQMFKALSGKRGKPATRPSAGTGRSFSVTELLSSGALEGSDERPPRPLPSRPSPEARIGSEVHRWIEEQARGLTGVADEDTLDRGGTRLEDRKLAQLKAAFVEMGYVGRPLGQLPGGEPMAELRFALKVGDHLIRGRMDAVYRTEEGGLEIVDFKSGTEVVQPEIDQLLVYAAALSKLGADLGSGVKLTYCYLDSRIAESRVIRVPDLENALATLEARLRDDELQASR
ncbi:MAG: ATP-dependent helicase [Actinomycetota bacterium]|nr:ATP-dependent helicase [Actinomycetota bacterium]